LAKTVAGSGAWILIHFMEWALSVEAVLDGLEIKGRRGATTAVLQGMADLRTAREGEISFVANKRYGRHLQESQASLVFIPEGMEGVPSNNQEWVEVDDPSLALASVCEKLLPILQGPPAEAGVDPTARVDPTAQLGEGVHIGPWTDIGPGVVIGDRTSVGPRVSIERNCVLGADCDIRTNCVLGWGTRMGDGCLLHPGVILGTDGFGYHSDAKGHKKLPQIGTVVLGDDVEIGSHSSVDRARFAETRVGTGTRIDNVVQVGHNVIIGQHCILCSGVGVAGSTEIGNFVILAGQVGINGHIKVGDGVIATGKTGISKDVPPGTVISGTPGQPHRLELRQQALAKAPARVGGTSQGC
jgi:UDP-3-O-[3-hydroxymyristoyl] glucosamine N-acyltransferase